MIWLIYSPMIHKRYNVSLSSLNPIFFRSLKLRKPFISLFQIGLSSWNSLSDATGKTPYNYAAMRNNHNYNFLVARKLADTRNKQVSLNIENEIVEQTGLSKRLSSEMNRSSCATCATVALKYQRRVSGSHRLFPTPIIHSMLAVATVCVCVCVFMHAFPIVRQGSHFSWGGLDYGSI